jgi:UDP-N-acetylglucosamine 2-epimerase (non-hydrolysing)
VTVEVGTNSLVGIVPKRIVEKAESVLRGHYKIGGLPELWDGKASERIVSVLAPN